MQYRPMEITVISAKGLKRVKHLSKMDVYVLVSLTGGPEIEKKTPVDRGSGPNPNWNFPMNFNVDENEALKGHLSLQFKVMCHRRVHSDKDIGAVTVPIKELLENGSEGKFVKFAAYQLKKPNGKHRGELNLSYRFSAQTLEASSSVKNGVSPAGYPTTGQYFPAQSPFPAAGFGVQNHPVGYIPVYADGPGFGLGFVSPPGVPQRPNNGETDVAFLSGVLGGLMIGERIDNPPAGDILGGATYSDGCEFEAGYFCGSSYGAQVGGEACLLKK